MLSAQAISQLLRALRNERPTTPPRANVQQPPQNPVPGPPPASKGIVHALPPHWQAQMRTRKPRGRDPDPLSPAEVGTVIANLERRMGQSRADNTWSNIASVLNQFDRFDSCQTVPAYTMSPLPERMAMRVEYKIQRGMLSRSSPVLYAKKLQQAFREITGQPSPYLREYIAALRRRPDAAPLGATPITAEQFRLLLSRIPWPEVYIQLLLQWLTASRADDMNRLRPADIEFFALPEGGAEVSLTWRLGVKGSVIPFTDFVILTEAQVKTLKELLARRHSEDRIFRLDAAGVTEVIHRFLSDELSSHSIKKGALTHLIGLGHSLNSIAYKAKHRSIDLLRVYVGPRAWAIAHQARTMAQDLSTVW
jgi:hypothetical protein